jgi:hypothetical protein
MLFVLFRGEIFSPDDTHYKVYNQWNLKVR